MGQAFDWAAAALPDAASAQRFDHAIVAAACHASHLHGRAAVEHDERRGMVFMGRAAAGELPSGAFAAERESDILGAHGFAPTCRISAKPVEFSALPSCVNSSPHRSPCLQRRERVCEIVMPGEGDGVGVTPRSKAFLFFPQPGAAAFQLEKVRTAVRAQQNQVGPTRHQAGALQLARRRLRPQAAMSDVGPHPIR